MTTEKDVINFVEELAKVFAPDNFDGRITIDRNKKKDGFQVTYEGSDKKVNIPKEVIYKAFITK